MDRFDLQVDDSSWFMHSWNQHLLSNANQYVSGSIKALSSNATSCLCPDPRGWMPVDEHYNVSPCFIEGILLNLPNVLLLVFGIAQLRSLNKLPSTGFPLDWRIGVKSLLVAVQIGFFVTLTINGIVQDSDYTNSIWFWGPLVSTFTSILALYMHYVEAFRTFIPTGSLLFYWFFNFFFYSFAAGFNYVNDNFHGVNQRKSILYLCTAVNSFVILIAEQIETANGKERNRLKKEKLKHPYDYANVFSKITFSWMSPLMKLGTTKFLTEDDLPDVPENFHTKVTSQKLETEWSKQVDSSSHPSLIMALCKAFGSTFALAGFYKAVQDSLAFVQPQLLRVLIKFINDYLDKETDVQLSQGIAIAFAMFLVAVLQTSALHQYFQLAIETGMHIKSSLTSMVFGKSLKLSNEEKGRQTTGDIVNLMSVDTQRLQDLCQYGQIAWSGPFQIVICLVSLHGILGNSMWAGVFVMILMVPVNSFLAQKQKVLQKRQMKNKDERTRLTSEILTNIKSLKLYGWEAPFVSRLNHVRNDKELETLKEIGLFSAAVSFIFNTAPFFVSCSTFAIFVFTQDRPLTTDIVFPALALFNMLSFPLAMVPMVITSMVEAMVAVGRLTNFLTSEDLQPDAVQHLPKAVKRGEDSVVIKDGTFLWERQPEYKVALADINYTAHKGELSCIVGKVGAGKSSFLQAILGDLYKSQGEVSVKGSIAYVAQVPWIMNASVKDNILFGCKYDPEFYQRTIDSCALVDDFAILPEGDKTVVGEKGISLSGGQKARISLARAVYARADVYLLDDPLSAVDEHVGRHIIQNVLSENGLLASKTIILATNSILVLGQAHRVTMLVGGRITESQSTAEILENKGGAIHQLIAEFGRKTHSSSNSATSSASASTVSLSAKLEAAKLDSEENSYITDGSSTLKQRRGSDSSISQASLASFEAVAELDHDEPDKDDRKEHLEQGKVKWSVYKEYAKASNSLGVIVYLLLAWFSMGISVAGNVWLKRWSEVNTGAGSNPHVGLYLGVYLALGITSSLMIVIQTIVLMIYCSIRSAKILHERMINAVIRAPMAFFETTPLGRIINRFSNDIYKVDQVLARTFSQFFGNVAKVFFTLVVITYSTPAFIVLAVPLVFVYLGYQRYYLLTSRELKRLDSVSKSPVYAHFQEALGGLSTIRAYSQTDRFNFINFSRIDMNLKAYYPSIGANRWLAVRLEFIGAIIIFAAAALGVISLPSGRISAGAIGLALSYALSVTQSLNWIVRMTVEVETNIVSVERILEYSDLKSEAPEIIPDHRPPAAWPTDGVVNFVDYSTRYRTGLPLVLKDINLAINSQEKIGIVGRTGAGKSSLTLALFRIIEAAAGHIDISEIDTSTLGLHDLRQRLSIIPQDSQAFEGTIRDNLDPEGVHDDTDLWHVLELSKLKEHIQGMEAGLESKVYEGGSNLSVGQRQLMCLARALLTPSKILVLDEATAAVDVETDKVIQETIRSAFKDRTILTIAHRLNTIMDSDRIVVLSEGRIAEFDTPSALLANRNSMFYSLAKQGGVVEE